MGFEYVHKTFKADSCGASLDRHPYLCSNSIQAVAEPFFDIKDHCAIFGVCCSDLRRNFPPRMLVCLHLLPPGNDRIPAKTRGFELRAPSYGRIQVDTLPAISWADPS